MVLLLTRTKMTFYIYILPLKMAFIKSTRKTFMICRKFAKTATVKIFSCIASRVTKELLL